MIIMLCHAFYFNEAEALHILGNCPFVTHCLAKHKILFCEHFPEIRLHHDTRMTLLKINNHLYTDISSVNYIENEKSQFQMIIAHQ